MNVHYAAGHSIGWRGCGLLAALLLSAAPASSIGGAGANNPPRVIIGPNQTIGVHPNVPAVFTLDGSQSFDPDGDPITYQWKNQDGVVVGSNSTVQLATAIPGIYPFALLVCDTHTDPQGQTAHFCGSASTIVTVAIDVIPPLVDAPDITVSVTDPGSATVSKSTPLSNYMLKGTGTSAVDNVDAHPQFQLVTANGNTVTGSTVFPEGDTPLVALYTDQAGNVGSSPSIVHVVDRQANDLYLQTAIGNCFGAPCTDVMQRIRGGAVDTICQLVDGPYGEEGLIVDSSGRIVTLRTTSVNGISGTAVERCFTKGAPPEKLAFFPANPGGVPPGYNHPLPELLSTQANGLTLTAVRQVVIDDNQNNGLPFLVNEDGYLLALVNPGDGGHATIQPVLYHTKQNFWEKGTALGAAFSQVNAGSPAPSLLYHSGATYAAAGGCLDRIKLPLSIEATGNAGGLNYDLHLNLFTSQGEICGWVLDNVEGPHVSGPPCNSPAPTDGSTFFIMDGFNFLLFDDNNGYGLTVFSNSAATGSDGVLPGFSELPFDDPGNPGNFFMNPLFGCAVENEVRYDGGIIGPPKRGGFWGVSGATSTTSGLVGASPYTGGGIVFPIQGGFSVDNAVATNVGFTGGIGVWPPSVSAGESLSLLIRIDSPVDVLVTDPNGKKLGVLNGAAVNDFGSGGADTGTGTHPRFYAINNPVAGGYVVQGVGTGSGAYTVHVYAIDTSKPFGQHILSSGMAAPGAISNQNFTMDDIGGIAFTNHAPMANAGADQTVAAGAGGTATVALDGSASSDPDGDALTYTWAGPFGLVAGVAPQVTLPVGVNVLQLTVADGKGGAASANVTITVNAPADTTPPVVTPPASISIAATEAGGARGAASAVLAAFLAGGTAIDSVDPAPVRIPPQAGGMNVDSSTLFPLGSSVVTFRFQDASGNVGSATASVTVSLGTVRIAAAVIAKGRDASGNYYVDVQFSDTGNGNARGLNLTQVALRTLAGSGTITYNAALSGALPLAVGNLDAGSGATLRIYLALPPTVTRFSITETGTVQDVTGAAYSYSLAQSVIP